MHGYCRQARFHCSHNKEDQSVLLKGWPELACPEGGERQGGRPFWRQLSVASAVNSNQFYK